MSRSLDPASVLSDPPAGEHGAVGSSSRKQVIVSTLWTKTFTKPMVRLASQQYAGQVASLELLDALNTGANTVTSVANALGISSAEAMQQLSAATARGLVTWEDDDSHLTELDAPHRFAHLSTAGREERHRLKAAPAGP
jgi:hypothetical protein